MREKNILSLKKLLFLFLIGTAGLTGCKKFLDINQNPNNPDSADPNLLLPTVQAAIGQVLGNSLQTTGNFYAQYWTQNPNSNQYRDIEQYSQPASNFNGAWFNIYIRALENAQLIINSKTAHIEQTKGMAYVLKAYAFQIATDAFGDVPLSQALQGVAYRSPKYESQQLVYDSVFNYIDKGIALLGTANSISPDRQDLLFHGDVNKWKAFANTLKLRAYIRISGKDATKARAGITALYQAKAVFLSEDAAISYSSTGGNENPLYNEMVGLGKAPNIVASSTAVVAMKGNNDPRLKKFYNKVADDDTAEGDTIAHIPQGGYLDSAGKRASFPSALVGANPTDGASALAPVKFISAAESKFLQAEAVVRGLGATGDVTTLFNAGIGASFIATGLTDADATNYIASAPDAKIATAATLENKIKLIITQKYYSMTGFQGFEAWTEYRRTGYPNFLVVSRVSVLAPGQRPLRLLYADSESVSNLNYPGTIPITTPLWWATK